MRFKLQLLTPERIPEAFPVVAILDAEITPQRWLEYARAIVGANGHDDDHGIMTLLDPRNCIVGLSAFTIRPDLQRGRILMIEIFAVVALLGGRHASAALLRSMEQLARARDCRCLAVSLLDRKIRRSPHRRRSETRQFLQGAGFRLDLARLSKCFSQPRGVWPETGAASAPTGGGPRS